MLLLAAPAMAQERLVGHGELAGPVGHQGCRAALEQDLASERDSATLRFAPRPGQRLAARFETVGIIENPPGILRFDSQVVVDIWPADAPPGAAPMLTRIERRFRECDVARGTRLERFKNVVIGAGMPR